MTTDERLPTYRLSRDFLEFFASRRSQGDALAMIAVTGTEGSSYSKAGHLALVDLDGSLAGIVSGGCLEGDLARRAAEVMDRKSRAVVDYDLRNEDEVFGLGVGCGGGIHLLLEPLLAEHGYEPLASVIDRLADSPWADLALPADDSGTRTASRVRLFRPANILVLGAGPDVPPLVQMVDALGWTVTVSDHRPRYVELLREATAATLRCGSAETIATDVDLGRFDAAVIMTHNLAADRAGLAALAACDIGFVGLLGPAHRRDRLLGELGGDAAARLDGRLHAPVGQRIGGRGPGAIALEIVAELQAFVCSLESA